MRFQRAFEPVLLRTDPSSARHTPRCGILRWILAVIATAGGMSSAPVNGQATITSGDILIATDQADMSGTRPPGIYKINPTTKVITSLGTFAGTVPAGERAIFPHPDGSIYLTVRDATSPSLYRLNLGTGVLTRISGLTFSQPGCACDVDIRYLQIGMSATLTPSVLPLLADNACARCSCMVTPPDLNRVFTIDRGTGAMTALSTCGGMEELRSIHGLAVDANGDAIVLTTASNDEFRIVRVNVASAPVGTITHVFTSASLAFPLIGTGNELAIDTLPGLEGQLLVYNSSQAQLSLVQPALMLEETLDVVPPQKFVGGTDMSVDPNGDIYLVNASELVLYDRESFGAETFLPLTTTGRIRDVYVVPTQCMISVLTQPPAAPQVCEDASTNIGTTASGPAPLFYEWTKNGQKVGTNSTTLALNTVPISDNAAQFRCRIMSRYCGANTIASTLSVIPAPEITQQPSGPPAECGGTAFLSVVTTGPGLSFSWMKDGSPIGTDSPTLAIPNVTFADDGSIITVQVTNACGMDTSTNFALDIIDAAPDVADIANTMATCDAPYVGPTPALDNTSCLNGALTWSLLQGPTGMTINPATGVVTWPTPIPSMTPYTVGIQAQNSSGSGAESWQLTVSNLASNLDCNTNCTLDSTDIMLANSLDCQTNSTPDECDIEFGTAFDCNSNDVPDACENDSDGDGATDLCEQCPNDPNKFNPGTCGCGVPDPVQCQCGVPDTDSDGDLTADCNDLCPNDDARIVPNDCGCNIPNVECFDVSLLGCPPNLTLTASDAQGVVLNFAMPLLVGPPANRREVTADQPSGTKFPIGTTVVTFTGRDTFTNRSTNCTFSVTVTALPGTGGGDGNTNDTTDGNTNGDGDGSGGSDCGLLGLFGLFGNAALGVWLVTRRRHPRTRR